MLTVQQSLSSSMAFQHIYNCRREETGMAGVSLGQIRDHLLQNIPGLKEHGISKHTVARLMEPPR